MVSAELIVTLVGFMVAAIAWLRVSSEFSAVKEQFLEILGDLAEILLALRSIAMSPEDTTQEELDNLSVRSMEVYEDLKSLGPKIKDLLEEKELGATCQPKL